MQNQNSPEKEQPKPPKLCTTLRQRDTYYDNKVITTGEPIRLEITDLFLYFCYHLVRKEYIRINAPARFEADAKYIVTVSNCHWIWEINITVLALLTYVTQNVQVNWNYVKSTIKEAPTEEVLCTKIAEHECYTELVETILKGVTDVSQAENPSTKTQENNDAINVVVKFIRGKHIKPMTPYSLTLSQEQKMKSQSIWQEAR